MRGGLVNFTGGSGRTKEVFGFRITVVRDRPRHDGEAVVDPTDFEQSFCQFVDRLAEIGLQRDRALEMRDRFPELSRHRQGCTETALCRGKFRIDSKAAPILRGCLVEPALPESKMWPMFRYAFQPGPDLRENIPVELFGFVEPSSAMLLHSGLEEAA